MKATITFYPNTAKKIQQSGNIPMYMRICINRTKAEARLNAEISEADFSKWNDFTMRIQDRNSSLNHHLNRFDQKFNDFVLLNADCLSAFSARIIMDYVLGLEKRKKLTIIQFVDNYFSDAVLNNVDRTQGTVKNYRRAVNHLVNFLNAQKLENLPLEDLNFELACDFKNYLVSSNPAQNRVGMTEVSASGVIKKFRTIFTQAVDKELIKKNPFKLIRIKTKSPRRERLTIGQVQSLWNLNLPNYPFLPIYLDLFLFCAFTGLAEQSEGKKFKERHYSRLCADPG